jgi:hypothetical protein
LAKVGINCQRLVESFDFGGKGNGKLTAFVGGYMKSTEFIVLKIHHKLGAIFPSVSISTLYFALSGFAFIRQSGCRFR